MNRLSRRAFASVVSAALLLGCQPATAPRKPTPDLIQALRDDEKPAFPGEMTADGFPAGEPVAQPSPLAPGVASNTDRLSPNADGALAPSGGAPASGGAPPAYKELHGDSVPASTALGAEASADRLHDLGGSLLLFYAVHRRLPARLDDLLAADASASPLLVNPAGKAYAYTPAGLVAPGRLKRIILHDPDPTADGKRWCLLMETPRENAAMSVEVLALPEGNFQTYQSAAP